MIASPRTLVGQILAYAVGGGMITLLHSLSYWVMAVPGGIEPYFANSLAALIAGISGYVLHSRWTFGNTHEGEDTLRSTGRYLIVSVLCYLLNSFWVWLCVHQLGRGVTVSIVPMILVTPWLGFAFNRFWTFAK
jgi:putative flippase GtrA